jgi:hypothetical protein
MIACCSAKAAIEGMGLERRLHFALLPCDLGS